MPAYFRLQEPKSISAATIQSVTDAIDIGAYKSVVLVIRLLAVPSAWSLQLETANVLDDDSFALIDTPSLTSVTLGNQLLVFSDLGRYIRWRVVSITGSATFQIDATARES